MLYMVLEYGTIQTGTSDGDAPGDGSRLGLAGGRAELVGLFANVAIASGINILVTSNPSEIHSNTSTASKLNIGKLSAREYELNSRTDEETPDDKSPATLERPETSPSACL
jgi:hypothetical protein